jgi:hypothetical protein
MDTWTHEHMDTWIHGHMDTWIHGHINTWTHGHGDKTWTWRHGNKILRNYEVLWEKISSGIRKTEGQAIFRNLFTVYSLCKWKFVVCPFVDEETKESYPFANRIKGLNELAHLCL